MYDNKNKYTERKRYKNYTPRKKEKYITDDLAMGRGYNALISYCLADTRLETTGSQMADSRELRESEDWFGESLICLQSLAE